ncbi:MAG: ABC transporter ATP-binding protein [Deltaproteobacteria bacterium]|nr:MAG: ABC transporter ATP-binding protein [Deltaproteobacteria bacterium]
MDRDTELAVTTEGLIRRFGSRQVIKGLDLRVPRGVIYGFLGRNGAGKTTTLRMLVGILSPHGGTMALDGHRIRRTRPRQRRRIGYVSQQQHFYPWMKVRTLGRFVGAFYPTWDPSYFASLLERLSIEPNQRVGTLSGGTRMKLAMALALAHRPPLLLLDEPTAGVDPVTRREILDLLRQTVDEGDCTVVFSTHTVSEVVDIGDQVGILHDGRIFFQGSVSDFAARVRRVGQLPEGALALHEDDRGVIGWGDPEIWRDLMTASVSLEEAFVAIARQDA